MTVKTKDSYLRDAHEQINVLRKEVHKVVVGLDDLIDAILIAILGRGHILIEGEPGLAKTLAVKIFAKCIKVPFSRISFTTDVNPTDLIQSIEPTMKPEQPFIFLPGPLLKGAFLLGDELNRTPPKTQSGLLEAMEEGQVTIEGKPYDLRKQGKGIHTIFAVQNPIEREATYPLAEALMERFLEKLFTNFPTYKNERIIAVKSQEFKRGKIKTNTIFQPEQLVELGNTIYEDFYPELLDPDSLIMRYITRIVREFRKERKDNKRGNEEEARLEYGISPRGTIDLTICSRVYAFLQGSEVVLPEHAKVMTYPALRGKFNLTPYTKQIEGMTEDMLIKKILGRVSVEEIG